MATKKAKPAPKPKKPTAQQQIDELKKSLEAVAYMVSESMERSTNHYKELLRLTVKKSHESQSCDSEPMLSYEELKIKIIDLINDRALLPLPLKINVCKEAMEQILLNEESKRQAQINSLEFEQRAMDNEAVRIETVRQLFNINK